MHKQKPDQANKILEFKLTASMFALRLNPPLDVEEEKYTIAITNSEKNNSVSNTYEHNEKFTLPRKPDLNVIMTYVEDHKYNRSPFNGETLTCTILIMKKVSDFCNLYRIFLWI